MGVFRESFEPFVRELKGHDRWLHIAVLALAALFLCYQYLAKDSFMRSDGYGIPALVSGEAELRQLRGEIRNIEQLLSGGEVSPEEHAPLNERLSAARLRANEMAPDAKERARIQHYMRYIGWFVATFIFLFVIPVLFIALHPRLRLRDFGLGLGDWRFAGKIAIIFGVVMVAAVLLILLFDVKSFLGYYPLYAEKRVTGPQPDFLFWFLILEFCFLLYFIGWEFYFRALMLFPLEKYLGSLAAVVAVLPFALVHIGKPIPEVFGSILAAWLLCILVLRTRSFWICGVLHFGVSFAMNLVAALSRNLF
jgi:hypothetical protein